MSLATLQSWLLEDGVREDLSAITLLTVRNELDNLALDSSAPSASVIDWPRLLLAGSILARSGQRVDQEAALRVATAAISLCSGLMKPDTHLGENARQNEVSDDQTTP